MMERPDTYPVFKSADAAMCYVKYYICQFKKDLILVTHNLLLKLLQLTGEDKFFLFKIIL